MNYTLTLAKILCALWLFASAAAAQSTLVDYPTPVSTNEIAGRIPARDLGDARLTTYYYTFNGSQGDIFVNVSAENFNGDIDIFAADGLRPLSKISFFADTTLTETGRVLYLRKPEKLILRVQGRTPDDNPATFKIKFAGSFVAVEGGGDQPEVPRLPEISTDDASGVRVNSVGTIIKPEPKATPARRETAARAEETEPDRDQNQTGPPEAVASSSGDVASTTDSPEVKTEEVNTAAEKKAPAPARRRTPPARNNRRRATTPASTRPKASTPGARTAPRKNEPKAAADAQPNPLENVRMVVLLKDGERLELPMVDVFRFSMNNGTLTITTKDGKIIRKSLLEIREFSIK